MKSIKDESRIITVEKIFDYRGDCWKAYQDVGLCLRILPPGRSFECIVEHDQMDNLRKIISRNGETILSETSMADGIQMRVEKVISSQDINE